MIASKAVRTVRICCCDWAPTFSAAQNLSSRLERETDAIMVGTPSGSRSNHCGDAQMFVGEASGIIVIVSTVSWFDGFAPDTRSWILPDISAPELYADWLRGDDAALEAALTHMVEGPRDPFSAERVYYFARPSQQANWQPFWRELPPENDEPENGGEAPAEDSGA